MPSSLTQMYYHIVFGTKHREPVIAPDLEPRLYDFIGGILRAERAQLIAGNGAMDHVHLLVRTPPDLAPSAMVREVKARTSRWMHESVEEMNAFAWQRGYAGFTVSTSAVADVETYIRRQKEKHRELTFEEEYIALLRKNDVSFDPRYVWG